MRPAPVLGWNGVAFGYTQSCPQKVGISFGLGKKAVICSKHGLRIILHGTAQSDSTLYANHFAARRYKRCPRVRNAQSNHKQGDFNALCTCRAERSFA